MIVTFFIVQTTGHSACKQDVRATFNSASVSKFCAQHFLFGLNQLLFYFFVSQKQFVLFFWLKRVLDRGPVLRESKMTVLRLLIIIILISWIIIYYIIIKSLIMENHPSWNRKQNPGQFFSCHSYFFKNGKICAKHN